MRTGARPDPAKVLESVGVFLVSRNTERPETWDHLRWEVVEPMVEGAKAYAQPVTDDMVAAVADCILADIYGTLIPSGSITAAHDTARRYLQAAFGEEG